MAGWVQNASPEVDAASSYPTIIAVCVCVTLFMMAIVSLRIYVRAFMLKVMGIDDWIIIFSAICSIVYNGLCIGQSRWGLGLPIAFRPPQNLDQYAVINFSGRPLYQFGILGFKVALCMAYLRILSYGQQVYRFVIWCVLITCTMGHVAGALVLLFQCKPVQKSWLPRTPGDCLANVPTFLSLAIVTIVFDIIIFFLPIPFLWKLQINRRRKGALMIVFLLGLFTSVCSIMRMTRIFPLAVDGNSTLLVLWGTIELNIGISLTCIPALAPLFTYFREQRSTAAYQNKYPQNSHELHSVGTTKTTPRSTSKMDNAIKNNHSGNDDGDSQTFIISPQTSLDGNSGSRPEIQKTVEVSVDFEEGMQKSGISYERHRPQW